MWLICTISPHGGERRRTAPEAVRIGLALGLACERKRQDRSEEEEDGQSNGRKLMHGNEEQGACREHKGGLYWRLRALLAVD